MRATSTRARNPFVVFGGVLPLLLFACSSSDDKADTDGSTGDPSVLVGGFQVTLQPPTTAAGTSAAKAGSTSVIGKVYDAPSPVLIVWEEAAKEGSCRLLTPRVPVCNTPCGGSAACVENDKCQAYPTAKSVGTVQVTGIKTMAGATAFAMEPIANSYQPPAGTTLAYPPFAEGDAVQFEASGGAYATFTLQATGVSPLELLNESIDLAQNQAVQLSWTPRGAQGASTIHVKLDISHHGGSKGKIECDGEDTGSLTLAASLVTQLISLGVSGYPTIVLTRQMVGSTTIAAGRVELVISSGIEKEVGIPGLVSCTKNEDCPSGQTCQTDLRCAK